MNILSIIKKFSKTGIVAAVVLTTGLFQLPVSAAEINLGGPQDCDSNAVIYCGAQNTSQLIGRYNNGTSQNTKKSIQDIYSKFGISSAEVNTMTSTAVAGRVTRDGTVFVNTSSAAVATNAITAGRENIAGSTATSFNGTSFFTRPTSVSFRSEAIPAYIVMKNGVFQYAVLASCANPVTATPKTPPAQTPTPTAPKYTIEKTVAVRGSTTGFTKSVTVAPGTHVIYRINVASIGTEAAKNVVVKDVLPANVTYVAPTLIRDGVIVNNTSIFEGGYIIPTLANGSTTVFQFEAIVGQPAANVSCVKESLTNTGTVTATSLPATSSTAVVNKECAPVVVVTAPTCNNFEIAPGENRTVRVTKFDYTANDAKFVSAVINWDVNKTNDSTPTINDANSVVGQSHQYAADGTYLTAVTINFTLNGKNVTATGIQCQKQVKFSTVPPVVTIPVTTAPVAPVKLVNTGAGSNIALFGGVTVLAFAAYQWSLRRRLSL